MIDKARIDEMKKAGEVIITSATFKKSAVFKQDAAGNTIIEYKGKIYKRSDWLLTYGHEQYERLIA